MSERLQGRQAGFQADKVLAGDCDLVGHNGLASSAPMRRLSGNCAVSAAARLVGLAALSRVGTAEPSPTPVFVVAMADVAATVAAVVAFADAVAHEGAAAGLALLRFVR